MRQLVIAALFFVACAAEVTGGTSDVDALVHINAPSPQSFVACEPKLIEVSVTGAKNRAVDWSNLDPVCGSIATNSVFTPARISGSCTATVTSRANPRVSKNVTLNVLPERVLTVVVVPNAVALADFGRENFVANVTTGCGTFPAGQ